MEAITGIILAGGKSSRMGQDKGLIPLNGKPMIQHIIDPMAKICSRILIVTGNPMYGMFGFELVADEAPDYGPVIGILSGLRISNTERNLVLSCDTPYITFDLLKELALKADDADVVVASSNLGIHPLISTYNKSCIPTFEQAVAKNEHRLQTVLESCIVKKFNVSPSDEALLKNINSKEDLRA
ncbi:MAG: molybdenum cofactor guanylyltransferase [Flavobacteriales bacterium]|nr:molybdenum cofactor guanylyltransferase [Flavobacteriales bacterium]